MIYFLSICLDEIEWLPHHLAQFEKLSCPWKWIVVEGVSEPVGDTHWVNRIPSRVSEDGSHEWLKEHAAKLPSKIIHLHSPSWPGKVAMLNAALEHCQQPGLVHQLDLDELWSTAQIDTVIREFKQHPEKNCARYWCRYFVGRDITITNRNCYGNRYAEWLRTWRYFPGMRWAGHEPPKMSPMVEHCFTREHMEKLGCVFDHMAYVSERKVEFKSRFYGVGYEGLLAQWQALQRNTEWPTPLAKWLGHVRDWSMCDKMK